jgi:RNA polymerase sigma-32 factor
MWSLLKIGTTQAQRKLFFKLRETKNAILKMNDGEDVSHSAALALNVSDKEVAEMEQRLQGDSSLDAELFCGDGATALESLADDRLNQEELLAECQESQQLQQKVALVVTALNEKERFIIERRITSDEPLTLQEIATHFSISRERVRQIEEGALKKVRNSLLPLLTAA